MFNHVDGDIVYACAWSSKVYLQNTCALLFNEKRHTEAPKNQVQKVDQNL